MDPFSAFLLAALVAYVVAAPDQRTRTVSRGAAGAAAAASRAAGRQIRSEWAATAPARDARRTARHERWARTSRGRALLRAEKVTRATGRGLRFGWRLARAGVRVAGAAVAAIPDGWRDGTRRAHGPRRRWLRLPRRAPRAEPASDPDPSATPEDGTPTDGPEVPTEPDGEAAEPPQLVCPECGEPVVRRPPTNWLPAWGPRPEYSHADGEPLCPVVGPDGYRPADPVPAEDGPNDPVSAGENTNREENHMGNTDTAEARPIQRTELATVDDLRAEAGDAGDVAEVIETYLTILADWTTDLADRYAAAPFGTAGLARGVAGVIEGTPKPGAVQALLEALAGLRHEIDETTSLTEAAETLDADGEVGAFRTA
jgi:hypothetical protein